MEPSSEGSALPFPCGEALAVGSICLCFPFALRRPSASSERRGSSTSNAAKGEGRARARVDFGRKIGETGTGKSSCGGRCCFSWALLIFRASLEGLTLSGERELLLTERSEGNGTTNGVEVIGGREGSVRLYNDWYEVVIAVVTDEPFAIGVRISVCSGGKWFAGGGRGAKLVKSLLALFDSAFAWANRASLEGCRVLAGLSDDEGISAVFEGVGADGLFTGTDLGIETGAVEVALSLSTASSSMAASIALRTCEFMEDGVVDFWLEATELGGLKD